MNEVQMLKALPALLPTFGNPIRIVELGAYDGFHTSQIANIISRSNKPWQYIAVEADPRLSPVMPPFVTLVRAAIAAQDGTADFHLSSGMSADGMAYSGSSSLHPPAAELHRNWPRMEFKEKATVQTITLDTLCERYKFDWIDFIWCDIQGCEGDLCLGAPKMLPKTKWFFTEYSAGPLYEGQTVFQDLKRIAAPMVVHTDMLGDVLFCAPNLLGHPLT